MTARHLESLESRRMLSAALNASTGLLTVTGTAGRDVISVSVAGASLVVDDRGTPRAFPAAKVKSIRVSGLGGDDRLTAADTVRVPLTLYGGAGNDTLRGGAGAKDVLYGEAGNDVLLNSGGADEFNGGGGVDAASYRGAAGDTNVTADGVANDGMDHAPWSVPGLRERDNVKPDVEDLVGGAGSDVLTASAAAPAATLMGLEGDDVLTGRAGADKIIGGGGRDALTGGGGNDALYGDDGDDVLDGGAGDDRLFGRAGNDTLTGGAGNDALSGEAGNDLYVFYTAVGTEVDTVTEGLNGGTDRLDFAGLAAANPVAVDLASDAALARHAGRTVRTGGAGQAAHVEDATGGGGDDRLAGNAADNGLDGGTGSDHLYGGGGDDALRGSGTLTGGAGNDTLTGGDGQDHLDGGDGDDLIDGGYGRDFLYGGDGLDTVDYSSRTEGVDVRLTVWGGPGGGTIGGSWEHDFYADPYEPYGSGRDVLVGIENARGGSGDDTIEGDAGENVLWGNGGNDVIYAHAGNDDVDAGAGDDLIYGGDGDDTIDGDSETDAMYGEGGNDLLYAADGWFGEEVDGGDGDDTAVYDWAAGGFSDVLFNVEHSIT